MSSPLALKFPRAYCHGVTKPTRYAAWLLIAGLLATRAQAQDSVATLKALRVVDPSYIDTTAKACTDFFQYAVGAWLARDTIPPDYSYSGVGRDMEDRNEIVVRSVLEDAVARRASQPDTSTERKLGTYYATCMDSTAAEQAGLSPLQPMLDSIAAVRTTSDLMRMIASVQEQGGGALFGYDPAADPHDAGHYEAWLHQGGLGMPDRDYYTDPGHEADSLRQAYVRHVTKTLELAGETPAAAAGDARQIMTLETALAKASVTRVALREPSATDHPTTLAALSTTAPAVDWPAYFRTIGLAAPPRRLNLAEPAFFKEASLLLTRTPLPVWKAYLRFHLVSAGARWLSSPFVNEDFAYSSLFTGAKQLLPRWKRCLRETDRDIGEALGKAYVEKTFPPQAKARAREVIDDVKAAFRQRLLQLTWMSDSTRQKALDKLARMHEKVGYPDVWRDYSRLVVAEGPFVLNMFRANVFEWRRVVRRPGMPVDTTEWGMTVPTVNAYYDPTKNEMVFPAGALEPQTFDPNADDGANFGSLAGSWAGHEMTHGFDDNGRHYDAQGNLRDWWTAADAAKFTTQANLVVKQFDGYFQIDTVHVNGKLTLGENIADYGGVLTGYDALERALEQHGRPGLIDGYTPEQRFFLGYAQSWRSNTRPEEMRSRVTTDPHAPEHWRVDGPLSNDPEFAKAFGCTPGDPMVRPADSVAHIW
jgi:putative endopeptidase